MVREVTTAKPYECAPQEPRYQGVASDFGIKRNIVRKLVEAGCRGTVGPASMSAADALSLEPDGIFLSNGPGDPRAVDYAVETTKSLVE